MEGISQFSQELGWATVVVQSDIQPPLSFYPLSRKIGNPPLVQQYQTESPNSPFDIWNLTVWIGFATVVAQSDLQPPLSLSPLSPKIGDVVSANGGNGATI